jgi:alpha-ketoglutarate-dependent taurine dioxygenase
VFPFEFGPRGDDACTDRSTMIRPMGNVITTKRLTATVGAEVLDVDRDRLLHDPGLPDAVLDALEEHGVLLFREVGVDDGEQIAFGRRLGNLVVQPAHPIPEITVITQGPDNPLAEYFRGNLHWHIDGAMDDVPCRAGILSARVMVAGDGGTEFASTYAAYDDLSDEEKDWFAGLRVILSLEANLRLVYPNPTPVQLANWRSRPSRQHPLVWEHRSGRRSLVLGAAADQIVGMELDEGRALLRDLLHRATGPERVVRHDWTVGDMVIWDNTGVLHRVTDQDSTSPRELHRATVAGEEPIQ